MSDDTHLRSELRSSLRLAPVPEPNLAAIYRKRDVPLPRGAAPLIRRALAFAALAACIALLSTHQAQAVVESIETKFNAALRAMGIPAGPPVTKALVSKLSAGTHSSSLREAQRQVTFALVEPRGLPQDIRSEKIYVGPTALWNARSRRWNESEKVITFMYTRVNGKRFSLQAGRYDPSATFYAYMWQDAERPNGDPIVEHGKVKLIRYNSYHWRNGDQVMNVVADEGLSDAEVAAIRRAMGGTPLPAIKTRLPEPGKRLMIHP